MEERNTAILNNFGVKEFKARFGQNGVTDDSYVDRTTGEVTQRIAFTDNNGEKHKVLLAKSLKEQGLSIKEILSDHENYQIVEVQDNDYDTKYFKICAAGRFVACGGDDLSALIG